MARHRTNLLRRGRQRPEAASPETGGLFAMPSPFFGGDGVVRLLEPPDACAATLSARLRSGSYGRPFLLDRDGLRCLHFGLGFTQSAMRLGEPDALDLAYTRRTMAFLLFVPRPRSLLILGLGGGSLAKFCYRRLPATRVTAVEIDPDVIAFRTAFRVPDDDGRFAVVEGDGARHLAERDERHDVVVVDAFDHEGVAPAFAAEDFFANARRCLTGRGLLVMNIAGARAARAPLLARIGAAFGRPPLTLTIREDGNCIAFAFRDAGFQPRWKFLKAEAVELRSRLGLDFPRFAEQLERENA